MFQSHFKTRGWKILCNATVAAILATSGSLAMGGADAGKKAYENGNYSLAWQELKPMAMSGDADAMTLLGLMSAHGQGVPKDDVEAVFWYSMAAKKGNTDAQLNLAELYREGKGVEKNAGMAAYWNWRAAEAFKIISKRRLDAEYKEAIAGIKQSSPAPDQPVQVYPTVDLKKCKKPEYPATARRQNQVGKVELLMLIDTDGKVLESSIDQSSGFPELDAAALNHFAACTYTPGYLNGAPVRQLLKKDYDWTLR